jgi:hypothetical protein
VFLNVTELFIALLRGQKNLGKTGRWDFKETPLTYCGLISSFGAKVYKMVNLCYFL